MAGGFCVPARGGIPRKGSDHPNKRRGLEKEKGGKESRGKGEEKKRFNDGGQKGGALVKSRKFARRRQKN